MSQNLTQQPANNTYTFQQNPEAGDPNQQPYANSNTNQRYNQPTRPPTQQQPGAYARAPPQGAYIQQPAVLAIPVAALNYKIAFCIGKFEVLNPEQYLVAYLNGQIVLSVLLILLSLSSTFMPSFDHPENCLGTLAILILLIISSKLCSSKIKSGLAFQSIGFVSCTGICGFILSILVFFWFFSTGIGAFLLLGSQCNNNVLTFSLRILTLILDFCGLFIAAGHVFHINWFNYACRQIRYSNLFGR